MSALVNILLVTQDGCSPCKRIKRIVEESKNEIPSMQIKEVKFSSVEGMKLASEYQILFPPAVFIDGQLFGKGKIGEEDLKNGLRRAVTPNGTMK